MEENNMCKSVKFGNNNNTTAKVAAAAAAESLAQCNNATASAAVQSETATAASTTTPVCNGKGVQFMLATETEELLGSVTTLNCPGTRASARVIQKMKQDQTRPMTPPPSEREQSKKEEKSSQKTPSQMRSNNKTTWTNQERNCFFDALNEFGKDFEAVANCINAKLKRRNTTSSGSDYSFKTKDQVRQHYYQTYHKICKYVRYTDELKKPAQELYTLINYGEMRRKLQFLSEKHFMKLKQLIYQGQITVRCKGKNTRIKTPSCKALRRLNQLDDSFEDIRLPNKIEVLLSPANMETFGRVQALAQNPRTRAVVPLHKKLITFIKTFQYKWRSTIARLNEEKLFPQNNETSESTMCNYADAELCFQPKPGVPIHRPLLSITAYLSSVNICLTAYEERLGVKVRSETLAQERNISAANSKRPRTESGSEKRSPDAKKIKPQNCAAQEDLINVKDEPLAADSTQDNTVTNLSTTKLENSSGDELNEEINEFLGIASTCDQSADTTTTTLTSTVAANQTITATISASTPTSTSNTANQQPSTHIRQKRSDAGGAVGSKASKANVAARNANNFKPMLSDDVIKRIRRGWTSSTAADITIGDLYVVMGQDSKLELEYYWCEPSSTVVATSTPVATVTGLPYNPNDCDSVERVKAVTTATVSNKLKHLLLVANLSERVRKRQCNCGHSCERVAAKCKRDLITKALWLQNLPAGAAAATADSAVSAEPVFRTPMPPLRRPIVTIDPVRQLSSHMRQKMSRQVLVKRRILPPPVSAATQPYDLVEVRNMQNNLFEPIESANSNNNRTGDINRTAAISVNTPINNSPSSKTTSTNTSSTISYTCDNSLLQAAQMDYSGYNAKIDMPTLDYAESNTLPEAAQDESTTGNFYNGSVSPMHLLRDSTSNARWLEDNINDFSLTSLLGHLDEIDTTRDILDPSSTLSVISESSVDFRHKFQEISALLQSQEKD